MNYNSASNSAARGKSPFVSPQIRTLTEKEKPFAAIAERVLLKRLKRGVIAIIPAFVSYDNKERKLIFSVVVANKIQEGENAHGEISVENLIINANDWDYAIRNAKGNADKINLIKSAPNTHNFFIIGANRVNGYYMATYFEVIATNGNKLKNLLLRGDLLDQSGRTPSL
jgi:hypothetical protein